MTSKLVLDAIVNGHVPDFSGLTAPRRLGAERFVPMRWARDPYPPHRFGQIPFVPRRLAVEQYPPRRLGQISFVPRRGR